MLSQTPQQKAELSDKIDDVLKNLIPETVKTYTSRCGATLEKKLGMMREDVINDIRIQVWKALLTHNTAGKANLKTYVKRIIDYRFAVLLRQAGMKKYSSLDYFADVFNGEGFSLTGDSGEFVTEQTPETHFEKRAAFFKTLTPLTPVERILWMGLQQGCGIAELAEATELTRPQVVSAISRIVTLISDWQKDNHEA